MALVATDDALRERLEQALAAHAGAPAIVTAELDRVPALRAAYPATPIVAVGLRRAQIATALDAGADAALAGPLRPAELRARLRVLARRPETRLRVGPLELEPGARLARLDGALLEIPRGEFDLLCLLASAPGRVFAKHELDPGRVPGGRALERRAARLRRRLGRHAPMLVTVWGIGYRLGEPA